MPLLALPGATVRVVLGQALGATSPLQLPTAVTLLDVSLQPHAHWVVELPGGDNAFAFLLGGTIDAGWRRASAGQLLRTRADGHALALAAGPEGARFSLFAGAPLRQQRFVHGPFVARDAQQMTRFTQDHAAGRFGILRPFGRS